MALGSLLIQKKYGLSYRELVEEIKENPYLHSSSVCRDIVMKHRLSRRSWWDSAASVMYITCTDPGCTGGMPASIKRDLDYIRWLVNYGYEADDKQKALMNIIEKVYEQQKYMYDNRTNTVPHRIVSISQQFISPIICGKAEADAEFGAKLDLSTVDGLAVLKRSLSKLITKAKSIRMLSTGTYQREGHYPERVLADKIYRNRENLQYCKYKEIRLSGPSVGRPKKDPSVFDKRIEYINNADRLEVERAFSFSKWRFGMGLIRTRLEGTTRSSIALSFIARNIDKLVKAFLCPKTVLEFSCTIADQGQVSCAVYSTKSLGLS